MPEPTDQEKLEASKKQLHALKQELNKQRVDEQRRAELDRIAVKDEALRAKGTEKNEKGEEVSYWQKVDSMADKFIKPTGQHSYVQWQTGMMEIFEAMYELNKAVYYTPVPGKATLTSLKHAVSDKFIGLDLTKQQFKLSYRISVDDAGVLTTKAYHNEGKELTAEQKALFDEGILAWARQKDCNFDPTTRILTDKNGDPVNPAKLAEMNQDDATGLRAFFSGNYVLKLEAELEHQSPSP